MSLVISIDYGHIYCKFIVIIRVFGSLDYYGKKKLDLGPMLHLFSSTSNLASFFSICSFMVSSCAALPTAYFVSGSSLSLDHPHLHANSASLTNHYYTLALVQPNCLPTLPGYSVINASPHHSHTRHHRRSALSPQNFLLGLLKLEKKGHPTPNPTKVIRRQEL